MSLSSSERITKFLDKGKWIERKYRGNYCEIKISEDTIEQKQLVKDSIWK